MFIVSTDWLWYSLIFIAGLALGSYLNSWMWRVHENRWQWGGRSLCVHCNRTLAWYENIPLASFLILRGKCRTCRQSIPADYFLVELTTALFFVGVTCYHLQLLIFSPGHFFRDIFFSVLLVVVFVYDFKYYIILPALVLSGALIAFFINTRYLLYTPYSLLTGIAIGGGFFLLQHLVSRGRWIGGGDIYLGVMMGAMLGWPVILVALFIAYIIGALFAILLLILKKKNMSSEVPFGTFLAMGTLAAMFWGEPLMRWYLALVRL